MALTGVAAEVKKYTKSSDERLLAMAAALGWVENIEGDIVECGVWRGGNIILARKLLPDRVCWLYDTFEGMVKPQAVDVTFSGRPGHLSYNAKKDIGVNWAAASVEEVRGYLAATDTLDDDKLRFVVGPVEQTLLDDANIPDKIALLRLDTDWYASTKIELEKLYPRLVSGGVCIIDDYGHWMGCKQAVDEYFGTKRPKFNKIDYTAVSFVKP